MERKELTYFLIVVFTISYGLAGLQYVTGKNFLTLNMLCPAIVAFTLVKIFRKSTSIKEQLGFKLGIKRYLITAPFFVFIFFVFIWVLNFIIYPSTLQDTKDIQEKLLRVFVSSNVSLSVILLLLRNIVLSPILNLPIFIGEEVGWRAYMMPRLVHIFGKPGAYLTGGTIWSLWHAGAIALGHNYPGFPVLGNALFILFCIPVGMMFYYFYEKSGSILTIALCHGVMNWTTTTALAFFAVKDIDPIFQGVIGLPSIAVTVVVGFVFYKLKISKSEKLAVRDSDF